MSDTSSTQERSLRILHVLRSPIGGLFRHVVDLAAAQIEQGHRVGIVADSISGGAWADRILDDLKPRLALGVTRCPMHRDPHPTDALAIARVAAAVRRARPDVIHGHGSKGGLYARWPGLTLLGQRQAIRVYTPHGGSLHFAAGTLKGTLILGVERLLDRMSDLVIFESAFAAGRSAVAIGRPKGLTRVVLNGLAAAEFETVAAAPDAADFVYVGELRMLKGIDLFLTALASASSAMGRPLRAVLVGSGPDRALLEAQAQRLGLADRVSFSGQMPARQAFALGRTVVVPSRAESLPYVVLEAAAARRPIIATRVGGIPEIFGPFGSDLVPGGDAVALEAAMIAHLSTTPQARAAVADDIARFVQTHFSLARMADGVVAGYREALTRRYAGRPSGVGQAHRAAMASRTQRS